MSYIVTLRNGEPHKLSDEDGSSLRDRWESSKQSFPIRLGGDSILSSQIVSISKEQLTQADWLTSDVIEASKRIEAKDRCRGQYSMQCEINNIAKAESRMVSDVNPEGLKWTKLIVDRTWRELVRQRLRAIHSDGWCDYRAGECCCEQEYLSNKPRHGSWA